MRAGEAVADRFVIEELGGTGGMGTVYRARDRVTGELVALKTLAGVGEHEGARFAREAATLAQLAHPNIVRYVAHGVSAQHERYIVMEWLAGETLQERLARGRLAVDDALALGAAVAGALALAHRSGVVHRDIKPSNIMLPAHDVARAKLVDFGIARHVAQAGVLTQTGMMIGTPGYMAPEQVRGDMTLDARTDVFALGCVLYRCLTGESAFGGAESLAVLAKILIDDVRPPSTLAPEVPPALDDLIGRMLAKDRAARPAHGGELVPALAALAEATLRSPAPPCDADAAVTAQSEIDADTGAGPTRASQRVLTGSEHRLVSIVMSGSLPPASHEAGLDDRVRTIATAYGGRLEHITDGAKLVLFAHEAIAADHARRAARCALAMRELLAQAPLAVASGRARVDLLTIGELIDRAAVAMQTLAPGQIAIDDTTAGLLDERCVVTPRTGGAPALLRGLREDAEPARTLLGRATPMVGRDRELAMLESLWTECAGERVGRAVLVTAPAGGGKSRLRHELVRSVLQRDEQAELLIGRGDSLRAGSPFAMLADAIRRSAGVRDGDALEEQRAGLLARIERSVVPADAPRIAHLLGELADIAFPSEASDALRAARADPVHRRDAMREAWVEWLAAECAQHPVLLVLEDLHWGDRSIVEYVDAALRELAQAPLMVVALARPEVHDLFPRLWDARELQEIRLPALTRRAGEKLVRDLLGDDVTPLLVQRIVERSAGNAFFLEELIRAAAEGNAASLPDSVLSVLQQRLDQLGVEPKRALRAASVFGATFWHGGVSALVGGDAGPQLATLIERELVSLQPESRVPGEREYAFRHDLVREAAYAATGADDRALGHRLAAAWLVAHGYGDALALAHQFRLGDEPARAAEYYAIAAENAFAAGDNPGALAHAEHGVACGAAGELAGRLELVRAAVHNWNAAHQEARPAALRAVALFPAGSREWFFAQDEAFFASGITGQISAAMTIVQQLTTATPLPGAQLAKLRSVARAAIVIARFGPPQLGDMLAPQVEQLAAALTIDQSTEQRMHSMRALVARARGEVSLALLEHERAIASCERVHQPRELAFTLLSLGSTYTEIGAPERGLRELERGLQLADRIGAPLVAKLLHCVSALALHGCGRLDDAHARAMRGLALCRETDGIGTIALLVLGYVAVSRGDAGEARRQLELAVARATPEYLPLALATRARAERLVGELGPACESARAAMRALTPRDGFEEGESAVRLAEIEALAAAGEHDAAREATRTAVARIEQRAARIDEAWRATWLARPENAATLARRG